MKTKIKNYSLLGLSAVFFVGTLGAQTDTIKVKETKETIITHDSASTKPVKKPVVVDTTAKVALPINEHNEDAPRFHNLELGLRLMPTFSSLAVRTSEGDVIQGTVSMSNGYGIMLANNFNRHVGVQVEVNYLKISQKYKDRDLDRVVNVNYINIPILLSFNTDKSRMVNLNAVVGPQFGINVGAKTSANGNGTADTLNAVVAVKQGDIGLAYGTGLEFMVNKSRTIRIDLGFRGFYGLVNMDGKQTNNDPNTYNVIVKASRKTYGGYLGVTFLF